MVEARLNGATGGQRQRVEGDRVGREGRGMAADDPVVNTVIIGVGDYRGGKGANPSEGGLLGHKIHRIALLSQFLTYGLIQRSFPR